MKLTIDYSNTRFYKIVCNDTSITDCYVGHTTTDLRNRISQHKHCCNKENNTHYNYLVYRFIRDNGGFDNFNIILIETRYLHNQLEAKQEERKHIEELNASLNCSIPSRTDKEYRQAHQDTIRLKHQIYNKEHREIRRIQHNAYYAANKDKVNARTRELYRLKKEKLSTQI